MSQKCSATSRRTGRPCQQWAIHGGAVCYWHGGQLPNVQAAAARELATREAYARAAQQTRDPATIAGIAAEALLRKAEETNDPADYERASIAARRAADAAAVGMPRPGRPGGSAGADVDEEIAAVAAEIIELAKRGGEGVG